MKLATSLILNLLFYSIFSQSLYPRKSLDPILYPFYHGVASGDPLSNAVILWTRFTDDTLSIDSVE